MTDVLGRELLPMLVVDEAARQGDRPLRGRTKLTKLVFLLQEMKPELVESLAGPGEGYRFEPFYYGPFSRELLSDLERLSDRGLLTEKKQRLDRDGRVVQHAYTLTERGSEALRLATAGDRTAAAARSFLDQYVLMDRARLVDIVHDRFPQFLGEQQG